MKKYTLTTTGKIFFRMSVFCLGMILGLLFNIYILEHGGNPSAMQLDWKNMVLIVIAAIGYVLLTGFENKVKKLNKEDKNE